MPNYQVVRCAGDGCAKFQSQQEKKSNKWSCVVCGLKQSLKRVYFQSAKPKECRSAVMDLNMNRGQAELAKEQHIDTAASHRRLTDVQSSLKRHEVATDGDGSVRAVGSKWNEFSEDASDIEAHVNDEDDRLDKHNRIVIETSDINVPTECRPAKRPRHRALPALHAPQKNSKVANTHTGHSMPHKPSDSAVSRIDSSGALSQALASVRRQNRPVDSITAISNSSFSRTIGTAAAANTSKRLSDIAKPSSPSRWDSYASESDSGSDD
ncbi:hypothetical protein H4R20_004433 [Coemansia guatemalensis]|uniref:MRN complex-interacting protein N-terminal domain-containing protein n=1 Tax=Coemansia guatemalensis TaxID=2761395 RepID=A0A9W8LRR0_9FUNG|nr:hypothetical protein H4R20_004433 [Coemansia guatemalensis]